VLLAAGLRTAYAVVFEINTVYTRVFVHFYDGASISISRSNKIHLCQGDVNAGMQGRGHAGNTPGGLSSTERGTLGRGFVASMRREN
jgi:hypothetical protein